ncbi:MAG: hypothetical protein M1814_004674 [Vezdaea aestivalis]|nr:MAG: hypothetical protein M1814_004674 [Vezdaea aestivalis]
MADINSGCSTPMGAPTFPFQTVAFECSLFACIRTYTASVTDGSVVETEVKRSFGQTDWLTGENNPPGILRPLDMRFIPKEENCTFKERVKNQNSSLCTYNFNSISLLALGNFFWDFWNGTVAGKYFEHASSRNDAMDILYGGGITNFTHISGTLGGIADSMTAAIRLTGRVFDQDYGSGGGQGKVTGSVMISNTCIDVRWGWITLPAAVALLTLLLLASTVLLDRLKPDQPAWKTSSLPTLFHGLDPTELTNKEQLLTVTAMGKEAKGLWVKLTDEKSDTLHLKTCTQEGQAITRPLEAENSASTLTDIHMSQNHRRTW